MAKVLVEFTDKITKKRHYKGEEIEVSTEREKVLIEKGLIEPTEKKQDVGPTPKKKK